MAKNTLTSLSRLPLDKWLSRESSWVAWGCALTLAAANCLLAYFPLSISTALWTLLLGLVLPLCFFALTPRPASAPKDSLATEVLPHFPAWWVWALLACAVLLRIYRLTTLSAWPTVDEGVHSYFAAQAARHWDGRLLVSPSQFPAPYCWGLGLLFKAMGPSLLSLWLYPALWSLACLPLAAWAGPKLFSRSLAFFFLFFLAFGFWPLYLGRLCVLGGFSLFAELGALAALGFYWKSHKENRGASLAALTLICGLGFYTYFSWPLVAAFLALGLCLKKTTGLRQKAGDLALFTLGNLLALLPLGLALRQEYRGYFHHVWVGTHPEVLLHNLSLTLSYLRQLFWGEPQTRLCMGAVWGGLFNPVLGALGLMGFLSALKSREKLLPSLLFAASFLFLLPALLTTNLEMTRLVAFLPLWLLAAALGLRFLLAQTPKDRRGPLAILVLALSLGLDMTQFLGIYPGHWRKHPDFYGPYKSPEYARAYALLESKARAEGPGMILLNGLPDPEDQTLSIAVAGFNQAPMGSNRALWVGLLANAHAGPYLAGQFPSGQWTWLSQGLNRPDGGLGLEMVEVTAENQARLERWAAADRALAPLVDRVMEEGLDPDQSAMLAALDRAYPLFRSDPYLESVYWRLHAIHQAAGGLYAKAAAEEGLAIRRGLPLAHLYNEQGWLRLKAGDAAGARKDFALAASCRPNYTDAPMNLPGASRP